MHQNQPKTVRDGIDNKTLDLYQRNAPAMADALERGDRTYFHRRLLQVFPVDTRLLEVGCGSGADAALLLREGRHVVATDPSQKMLHEAGLRHPELHGLLRVAALPNLRFEDDSFDGIFAITVLMHLPLQTDPTCLPRSCREMARVIKSGSNCFVIIFDERDDIDAEGRDSAGRLQNIISSELLISTMAEADMKLTSTQTFPDFLGRTGFTPREYVFKKK